MEKLEKNELLKRVGDISQIARITDFRFSSGRAEGMRGLEVVNGSGLQFTVLPSRCMDIAYASYKGIPLSFISKSGLAAPSYYDDRGLGFLRGFTCGLLTTCGLTYMGAPCVDQGEELGLHGRIANTPSQNCSAAAEWEGNDYVLRINGEMRESSMFGSNMVLRRKIFTKLGSNEINIEDTVTNEGFEKSEFMLLYHCNFGYPIVSEDSEFFIDSNTVTPRDDRAKEGIYEWEKMSDPIHGFTEQLYFFDPIPEKDDFVKASIVNPNLMNNGLRVSVKFKKETLPYCSEWKQMGEGDYVFGIEPGTWIPAGRAEARRTGNLKYLEPGESYTTEFSYIIEEL